MRDENDFYETPEFVTKELLDREEFTNSIWEPACGKGAISDVLYEFEFTDIFSSDLIYRDYGLQIDFLTTNDIIYKNIITNPPYKLATEFILHAKNCSTNKIAMLLPTTFLESQKRYDLYQDRIFPLKCIYQFSKRISIYHPKANTKVPGKIAYAWFVWDKTYTGLEPTIKWIK